jgi:hypothetical protein
MEEMKTLGYFLDAPSFLDQIPAGTLGFSGPVLILVIFVAINRKKLSVIVLILSTLLFYGLSVLTGAYLCSIIGNRPSSFVAAFWAPVIYCSVVTVLVRVFYRPPEKVSSGYDHLIH